MTQEQRIRGKDGGVDWVLLVSGHDASAVAELCVRGLDTETLEKQGAINVVASIVRMGHALSAQEVGLQ